jgi:hypothetical protein
MNDRIIDKLRKVMAMTQSPVEAEAQTAMEMLQRLLTQYNLEMADLEQRGAQTKPGITEQAHDLGKAAFNWKLDLAETIAEHYYCWGMVDRYSKTVKFVGRPDNVESLKMLYAWVIDQIKRISSEERKRWQEESGEHVDPLRWQVNFGLGVVSRLGVRLREIRERQASDVTAIVLSHRTEISDFMEEKYGRRVDGRKTKQEEEWDRQYMERQAAKQRLKETDIEAYYNAYPHERPLTPEQQTAQQKELEKWEKRAARNAARRVGRVRYMNADERRKQDQAYEANMAGRSSADKVNLEPFLKDGKKPPAGELK